MARSAQQIIKEKNELLREYKKYETLMKKMSDIIPFLRAITLKDEEVICLLKSGFCINEKTADGEFFLKIGSESKEIFQKIDTVIIPSIITKKKKIKKRIEELDRELLTAI